MKVILTYAAGLRSVVSNAKMVFLLFAIQFGFALILLAPLRSEFGKMFGSSLLGQELLKGNTGQVFVEFLVHRFRELSMEMKLLPVLGLLYLVVTILLNGGIIGRFVKRGRFKADQFFADAGAHFWRFVRLFLLSIPFMILAVLLYLLIDAGLMSFKGDSDSRAFYLKAGGFFILGFLILLVRMVFDYARIHTVNTRQKGMVWTGFWAWSFVLRHFGPTVGLYTLLALTGLLLFGFFTWIMKIIPANAGLLIFFLFLWQQLHVLVRSGFKVMSLAGESALYLRLWKEDAEKANVVKSGKRMAHGSKKIPKDNRARHRSGGIHRKQSRRPASG